MTMQLAMMATAERYGELVARLAAQSSSLREAQVMRIRRRASAD
jgi:hypothetical protein